MVGLLSELNVAQTSNIEPKQKIIYQRDEIKDSVDLNTDREDVI